MSKFVNTTKYLIVGINRKQSLINDKDYEYEPIIYLNKIVVKIALLTKQGFMNHGQMFLSDEFKDGAIYIGMDLDEQHLIIQDSYDYVYIMDNLNVTHLTNFFLPERIREKNLPEETKNIFMETIEKEKKIKESLVKLDFLIRKI